ncbi:MAG: hypothetical protein E7170_00920 [Firmicutes bacterium]|nr:hypothetical protein [Bacillota bacterium]
MPSHKIHLAIAKKINDKLNLNLDCIMLGSILPDICNEKNHQLSHFQFGEKDIEGLANPDKFIDKYKDKLNNPIMMGYLIHILTDRYYNEYIFKNFYIYDNNDEPIGLYLKGKKKLLDKKTIKNLKHKELSIYDKWLMNNKKILKFNNFNCIDKIEYLEEASFNKENIKQYIMSLNKEIEKINMFSKFCFYNYKITNKKEFDKIFNECIYYILRYIENIK